MNRIDRLTAMITYLQGRRFTTVDELAACYHITPRTVYRDLSALQEAGIPLGSEPGKGYFIVKGYHLPPVMFSREEAASLLAAGRLMKTWEHSGPGRSYENALNKIRAILPDADKEHFEALEQRIGRYPSDDTQRPEPDLNYFAPLQQAIIRRKIVRLTYHSNYNGEKTEREVEPLGLLVLGNYWYLAGWCRKREDYRTFRLDRMKACRVTDTPFGDQHTLDEYHKLNRHDEKDPEEVVVRFDREMIRYMGDQKYNHGWTEEREVPGGVEMTFQPVHTEYLCRWLLIWGDGATVTGPDHIREKMKELVEELARHHLENRAVQTDR